MLDVTALPNDVEQLKEVISQQNKEISHLNDLVRMLRRAHYAPKSEVVPSEQLGLFNELEDIIEEDGKDETVTVTYERKRGTRKKIPDHLPRIETILDLTEEEKFCPHDGHGLKKIGEEVTEQLKIVPAHIEVIKTIRPKYGCPACDYGFKIKSLPPMLLPKTMATPSLIAFIIISKFADYLPLYRQQNILQRIGLELSRQTMARWLIAVSEQLTPLYNLLQDLLLGAFYLQMDESYTQVLNEKGKKATSKSYMWGVP